VAEDLVGGAAPSVAEEMVVAGVVRATAVDEADFQVLQEGALIGTKIILQVLTLGADTHQVVCSYEHEFNIMLCVCVFFFHNVLNVVVTVHLLK
jgi:hypothetical protein